MTLPRLDAWKIRFCNLNTPRSSLHQLMSRHLYIGIFTVFITYLLLLVAFPSVIPCVRQRISLVTKERWLLTQSQPSDTYLRRN
jgi:hypothetical protein